VWLVELAAVSDPDKLAPWIAESLRINRGKGGSVGGAAQAGETVPVIDQIVGSLQHRQTLLILDNCEHLIGASADFATYLLEACPDVKILTTSREGLGIAGETLWQVPSLEMPNRFDLNELGGTGADALRLFAERAAAVNPNFELTEETYPFVLKICRRLDGMPLAIELAAARAKSLDVARIADRLDDRFRLLTGGSRTALPRQQTLEAAVDWSYELLEESEQVFFNRLAAFRGGFTLEAAETVCEGGVVDHFDVVDHLSSLVDKSMVVWEGGRGDRYRLLETLRQYALGKLKDSGEADDVRKGHAEYFLEMAEQAAPHLRRRGQVEWMEKLETDHENFRAAMSFTDEHEMSQITARLAAALHWFWFVRGHKEEGDEWLGPLLGRPDIGDEQTVLSLMVAYAWHLLWSSDNETLKAHLVDTKGMANRLDDDAKLAETFLVEGYMRQNLDDYDVAETILDKALELAQRSGEDWAIGWASYARGWMDRMRADVDAATPHLDLAIAKMRQTGDTLGLAWASGVGAILARYRLDFETARQLHDESLVQAKALGNRDLQAFNYACIGIVDFHQGKYEDAIANHKRCADLERDLGSTGSEVAENLHLMADAQFAAGKLDDASAAIADALNLLDSPRHDLTVLAATLETLAGPLLDKGEAEFAARLWGWAMAVRKEVGRPVPPPNRPVYALIEERIATDTDDRGTLAAEGAALSYEEALAAGRQALTFI
jgi:predicted ATPase